MDERSARRLLDRLERLGVDTSRFICISYAESTLQHLKDFNKIDLALDPFPYSGTTITCNALLMGVPVVTMKGETHRSNVTTSILVNSGISGTMCKDLDEYVKVASTFVPGPKEVLRHKFLVSDVCNTSKYTQKFEETLMKLVF
jgi:predicted O-linked N-acetylglucosamine transferase (SPINDLY family)